MGAITDLAESINDARRSIWDDASTTDRILIFAVLVFSGIGIPVIFIALIAQAIAEYRSSARSFYPVACIAPVWPK